MFAYVKEEFKTDIAIYFVISYIFIAILGNVFIAIEGKKMNEELIPKLR